MDDIYQAYVNRVARQTLPEAYRSQVQNLQASPKFERRPDGTFSAVSFPGYSVITPPAAEDGANREFYQQLTALQGQLAHELPTNFLIPLPADSFHLTLADLIWDGAYRHANENPHFQELLRDRIGQSFHHCESLVKGVPLYCQVMGILLMPRALAVCLTPKDEESYDRITRLRRSIYQNSGLISLGIEQQYHLTAHITLGYFGDTLEPDERDRLESTLMHLNQQLLLEHPMLPLLVHRAELRKFDDMTRYYREENWPALEF